MDWTNYLCSNPTCASDAWLVQRETNNVDLWLVAASADDRPYMVAAVEPVNGS